MHCSHLALWIVALAGLQVPLRAQSSTFTICGTVTSVQSSPSQPLPAPWNSVVVGDTFTLVYVHDCSAADTDPSSTFGYYPNVISAFTFSAGGASTAPLIAPSASDIRIFSHQPAGVDQYESFLFWSSFQLFFELDDLTGMAFNGNVPRDDLPCCVDMNAFSIRDLVFSTGSGPFTSEIRGDITGCTMCDPCTIDTDHDGVVDCLDGCPFDPAKTAPGVCGCGVPDIDTDGDLTPDCIDGCPLDPLKIAPGACGCGVPDTDSNGDGVPDCLDPCVTNQVILNTGYDHGSGGVLSIGSIDARWTVVSDPQIATSEPRPATVIQKHPAWANPAPGSQWISGYPTSAQTQNGAYIFETPFCLRDGVDLNTATLQLGMRGDDACFAYVNESVADILSGAATSFHTGNGFGAPVLTVGNYPLVSIGATAGKNFLRIRVQNTGSVAMGLNLVATVTASPNGTADKPECCSNFGALQGLKYEDLDGDGVRDLGEPALSGWTINLTGPSGPQSAVTDSFGFYNFTSLMPGTYTLTETLQPGWGQTAPPSGSHVVTLAGIQGVTGLNFGNRRCMAVTTGSVRCVPGPGGWSGNYAVTFTVTNFSGQPAQYLILPNAATTPHVITLNPPLAAGQTSTPQTITISGASPATGFCFQVVLANANVEDCCSQEVCVDLPECDCLQLSNEVITCIAGGSGQFTYSFDLTNLTNGLIEYVGLFPLPVGTSVTIAPDLIHIAPVAAGGTATGIGPTTISGATAGSTLDILISVHDEHYIECCSELVHIRVPVCNPIAVPAETYCFGDGSAGPCPCGNIGAVGHGCSNSVHIEGAALAASGTASIGADTFTMLASDMPAEAFALFVQGDVILSTPAVFGDGLRCADGNLVRLATRAASGGAVQFPVAGDPPVSVRGGCVAGNEYGYFAYYRNASALFCPPATFNATSALKLTWGP